MRMRSQEPVQRSRKQLSMETLEPRVMLAADLQNLAFDPIHILDPYQENAVTVEQMIARAQVTPFVQGDLMVALQLPYAANSVQNEFYLDTVNWSDLTGVNTRFDSTLMQVDQASQTSFVLVQLDIGSANLFETMASMDESSHVLWTSPNFYLEGDQQDFVPDDPDYGQQYTHPLVGSESAWDFTLGDSNIVVGITDDGVELVHPDLAPNIWVNAGEIAGNGMDDDGNGYIDDVNGWDWANDNNDPSPNGGAHGTHVAGISAARTDNGIGVAGLSGHSTIMPLQFYGGVNGWTASIINNTFTYATDNGAHIVNTSYNINGWVGDPVFTAGMQYMYDNDVLHFNSAGNGNELNPARQAFEQTLLVVSTTSTDARSSFSNYGTGVDISAPGSDVYSTLPGNTYGNNSGTSMAAPNAAGAAALIWSANPTWTRDQVAAQLLATADNIDAVNPAYAGLLGAGRINVGRGVNEDIGAPVVSSLVDVPADGGVTNDLTIDQFSITFSQVMDPDSVNNILNYELRSAGIDGVFGNGDDEVFALTMDGNYQLGTNQLTFDINDGVLPFGEFQITVESGGVVNPFGTPLDGNDDGIDGDAFVSRFSIEPPAPTGILPLGSLIYDQALSGSIAAADTDQFAIPLDAGQTLTVIVRGAPSLVPVINVFDPNGQQIESVTATGSAVATNVLAVSVAGEYVMEVLGDSNSTGSYELTWMLNSGVEVEELDGTLNDTLSTAQDINATSLSLGTGQADRLAVVGELPSSDGTIVVEDDFESGALGNAWSTNSTNTGRIEVTGQHGTASGNFALLMDSTTNSSYSLNEAIWTVDLAGLATPSLIFEHAEYSDEEDPLPLSFSGSFDGDGVSISEDGITWHRVFDPGSQTSGIWNRINIDLETAANNAGIALGDDFQIKFQQYDNFALTTDGRGFDDIAIVVPVFTSDWYSFDLLDGQVATIAATNFQGSGSPVIELYDSGGNLVQNGTAAANVSSFIQQFVDPTSNATTDTWYINVSGGDSEYSLLVMRDIEFDLEPNDSGLAQDVNLVDGMLGFTSSSTTVFAEPDNYVEGTILDTLIPGVTLSNSVGGTSVQAVTAGFGAPTGSKVFSPGPASPSGWNGGSNELVATFDVETGFVSIDVGSDDSSDIAFLRAFDANGNLLDEVISGAVSTGGSETISIDRSGTNDIAYIVAAGLAGDVTPLDNLVFGTPGSGDEYLIDGVAGEQIRYDAYLPGAGPNWFINGLDQPNGSELRLELFQNFGTGASVASGIDTVSYTPAQAGSYRLVVTSNEGGGEYYVQRSVDQGTRFDFGTPGSPVQTEWVGVDTSEYNDSIGHGWIGESKALSVSDVAQGNDLNRDYARIALGTFVVDVPDADYLVTLHFGETEHRDDVRIEIEGSSDVFLPATNQSQVFRTTVRDGQLTIGFSGNRGIDEFVRIAGLEIEAQQNNFTGKSSSSSDGSPETLVDAARSKLRSGTTILRTPSTTELSPASQGHADLDARVLALSGMVEAREFETLDSNTNWTTFKKNSINAESETQTLETGLLLEELFMEPFV